MYLSHIFTRYFQGNKNDSPSSKWICAPLRLLKYSLITVFYPKVIVECVPKWITFPLSLPRSLSLSCRSFPPLLLSFSFLLLQVSFSLMACTCQPSGRGAAVTKWNGPALRPMLFLPGLDHSVLLTVHNPSPVPTHLSKPNCRIPIHQSPSASPLWSLPVICAKKLTLWVSDAQVFRLEGQIVFIRLWPQNRSSNKSYNCEVKNVSPVLLGL